MSASLAPAPHGAAGSGVGAVLRWCAWYTRGLPEQVAAERRDEIASDLHEHAVWAAEQGISASALARGIRLRALGGVTADLLWRHSQLRQHESAEAIALRRNSRGGLPVLAYTLSLLVLVASGIVVIRVLSSVGPGDAAFHAQGAASAVLALAASACALAMMARRQTRWVGALWMIVAVYCLVRYGTKALVYASATSGQLAYSAAAWDAFGKLLIVGLALFFTGMAVRWAPSRRAIGRGVQAATAQVGVRAARVADSLNVGPSAVAPSSGPLATVRRAAGE
ncbi:hypothetical protein [Microterricola viridarii]|uniref:Uncharacterized protein n=1 Tax=Microterricola viridarii TaxID=412690 RepID=A0A109QYA6_9MICO|nr:hypothetical protein [Microterricola viridarii]AMB60063.1 hypothetical protein AWU67_15695 [Microterricola viridarii]